MIKDELISAIIWERGGFLEGDRMVLILFQEGQWWWAPGGLFCCSLCLGRASLCHSAGEESTWNVGGLGSIAGLGRSPGEGKGYPLQYSGLENSMDCIVHRSQRVGRDWVTFTFTFCLGMGFPGGASGKEPTCQCRKHRRHRFDPWVRNIPLRRKWQPTSVSLPRETHGQRKLAGYSS